MAGIGNDVVGRFRPGLMQLIRGADRTDEVIAALHHDRRDLPDSVNVRQQMILGQEDIVHEVVGFHAGEPQGQYVAGKGPNRFRARQQGRT